MRLSQAARGPVLMRRPANEEWAIKYRSMPARGGATGESPGESESSRRWEERRGINPGNAGDGHTAAASCDRFRRAHDAPVCQASFTIHLRGGVYTVARVWRKATRAPTPPPYLRGHSILYAVLRPAQTGFAAGRL